MRYAVSPRWIVALGFALQLGCENHGQTLIDVAGTVTFRGDSVPGGTLLLQPVSGRATVATIDESGRYQAAVPAGTYQVAVVSATTIPEGVDPWKSKVRLPTPLVPERFGRTETSGLSISVPADSENKSIDIALE